MILLSTSGKIFLAAWKMPMDAEAGPRMFVR
jgi:hypothetical protein